MYMIVYNFYFFKVCGWINQLYFFLERINLKATDVDGKSDFIGKDTSSSNQDVETVNLSHHISDGDTSNLPVNPLLGEENHEDGI